MYASCTPLICGTIVCFSNRNSRMIFLLQISIKLLERNRIDPETKDVDERRSVAFRSATPWSARVQQYSLIGPASRRGEIDVTRWGPFHVNAMVEDVLFNRMKPADSVIGARWYAWFEELADS